MKTNPFNDAYFMQEAIKEAIKAFNLNEVPVGAIITCENQIIARAHNYTQKLKDATAHAEIQAFTIASNFLGGKYLHECTLYVTLEPCAMCAGAAYWTHIKKIVFGAKDPKRGFQKIQQNLLHPKTQVKQGILEKECAKLLTDFFKEKRK